MVGPKEGLTEVLGDDATRELALSRANSILGKAVDGVSDIIGTDAEVDVELEGVEALMPAISKAATATTTGVGRAADAAKGAEACPRLDGIELPGASRCCRPMACARGSRGDDPARPEALGCSSIAWNADCPWGPLLRDPLRMPQRVHDWRLRGGEFRVAKFADRSTRADRRLTNQSFCRLARQRQLPAAAPSSRSRPQPEERDQPLWGGPIAVQRGRPTGIPVQRQTARQESNGLRSTTTAVEYTGVDHWRRHCRMTELQTRARSAHCAPT